MTGWDLPEALEIAGRSEPIRADFREVLEVIRLLDDAAEPPEARAFLAMGVFYRKFAALSPALRGQAMEAMLRFLAGGEEDSGPAGPRLIDWQQDLPLIVADVNKAAGCEIRALPFVHWWTFLAWFGAIGEGQLSAVVAIRDKLRRGKKLEGWEREFYQRNRARVDLKPRYTPEEQAERERLNRLLKD
ncbi:Gp15 family bacteriophage protein [uncultured Allofournierella sp.]|uniref:Gp15 family bacteriophage protein n=1 Tax=uncultured Allofournierella sp. TaxID=1940258 RepID=UPI0025EA216A|nr:Gp15 family bacteriophage protein [uncultured Fournierella sp.]